MNKGTLYTIAISIVVIVIGAIMLVCGQLVNKDADRKFIGEMLNIVGGMIKGSMQYDICRYDDVT